ncbi:MAG: S16 family serine protease, partial [Photobacterium halotolerans]
ISAFSGCPINQSIAITGSMNQFGQAQPIGGVNEKIEGYFDVCTIKGRHNNQGVIIPQSNAHNLMLRKDILTAVEKGDFHIWAISHVSEAISLLTGKDAGDWQDGNYPPESVLGIAQNKLNAMRK